MKVIKRFLVARRDYVILTGLYLFHVINTHIWLKLDTMPLEGGQSQRWRLSAG